MVDDDETFGDNISIGETFTLEIISENSLRFMNSLHGVIYDECEGVTDTEYDDEEDDESATSHIMQDDDEY
jgi:hypothetical protein